MIETPKQTQQIPTTFEVSKTLGIQWPLNWNVTGLSDEVSRTEAPVMVDIGISLKTDDSFYLSEICIFEMHV